MGLQGFEGCDIPCEPGWQLQATDADCAEEDGGPIRQCTGVGSTGQVVQLFSFFWVDRIVVHSFQAKEPSGHQTNRQVVQLEHLPC